MFLTFIIFLYSFSSIFMFIAGIGDSLAYSSRYHIDYNRKQEILMMHIIFPVYFLGKLTQKILWIKIKL